MTAANVQLTQPYVSYIRQCNNSLDLSEPEAKNNESKSHWMYEKTRCIARFPCDNTALGASCPGESSTAAPLQYKLSTTA